MAGGAGLLRYDLRGGRIRRLRLPPRGLSAADEPRMKVPSLQTTAIAAAVLLCAGFALAFFYAPLDADQGFVQKIFYVHVPLAICGVATRSTTRAPTCRSTCRSSSGSAC